MAKAMSSVSSCFKRAASPRGSTSTLILRVILEAGRRRGKRQGLIGVFGAKNAHHERDTQDGRTQSKNVGQQPQSDWNFLTPSHEKGRQAIYQAYTECYRKLGADPRANSDEAPGQRASISFPR